MSTSPFYDGSLVRYDVQRAGRPVVSSYTRERDFPRTTRYTNGISYDSDYAYGSYDMTLAEQRELEAIQLRSEYARSGTAAIITTGAGNIRNGRTTYLTSGRALMGMHSPSGYPTMARTVTVAGSGPVIHRGQRYSNQPVGYAFGDYPGDYERSGLQAIRVPASSNGRIRRYSTDYDNRRVFGAACGYETRCRDQLVVVPSRRTLSPKRYY